MKPGDLVLFEDGNTGIVIKEPVMKKFVGPVVKLLVHGKIILRDSDRFIWNVNNKIWRWEKF